jgi:hypothetical protein
LDKWCLPGTFIHLSISFEENQQGADGGWSFISVAHPPFLQKRKNRSKYMKIQFVYISGENLFLWELGATMIVVFYGPGSKFFT